jgi:hypothetical protein
VPPLRSCFDGQQLRKEIFFSLFPHFMVPGIFRKMHYSCRKNFLDRFTRLPFKRSPQKIFCGTNNAKILQKIPFIKDYREQEKERFGNPAGPMLVRVVGALLSDVVLTSHSSLQQRLRAVNPHGIR